MNSPATQFNLGKIRCSSHSIDQFVSEVRTLLLERSLTPRSLLYLNAHVYNLAYEDAELATALNQARIVSADGMAIVWAARFFGIRLTERCNMTEAFRAFLNCPDMPHSKAILIGCTEQEAIRAATEIQRISPHCKIVESFSGFLTDSEYENRIRQFPNIDLLLFGMGTPRTEKLIAKIANVCPQAVAWSIGGGTIRIYAGAMKEAPRFWRRTGLQWIHRLFSEPRLMWRRYLLGNPLFAWRILRARLATKSSEQSISKHPD